MYVHQAKPANPARTTISSSLMRISESSFDYPPTTERRCAFQSRIKYSVPIRNRSSDQSRNGSRSSRGTSSRLLTLVTGTDDRDQVQVARFKRIGPPGGPPQNAPHG